MSGNLLKKFFLSSDISFQLSIWSLFSVLIFLNVADSLRLLLSLSLLMVLLLYLRFQNWFISFLLVTIFTLPFFVPNKYYIVEVIRGYDLALPEFRDGYYLGYGVNISNILLIFTTFFGGKVFLENYFNNNVKLKSKPILFFFCYLVFFIIGAFSSLTFSFSPVASLVWLLQYMQIALMAGSIGIFTTFFPSRKSLIFCTLAMMMAFQLAVATGQFFSQSKVGLAVEFNQGTVFNQGIDENNAIPRPAGTFSYHNQLGFISLIISILLLSAWVKDQSPILTLGVISSFCLIVVSQGRSVWMGLLLTMVLVYTFYKAILISKIKKIPRRYLWYGLFVIFLASFIIVPRVWLSMNAIYEGSGLTLRWKMIKEGLQALGMQPLFGYGVGTNEYILFSLFPHGSMSTFPAAIHLGFLQLALEVGWVGLIFFLLPFTLVNKALTQQGKFIYFALVGSCVVYYLLQPHVGIIEFAYLGLALGTLLNNENNNG